MIWTSLVAFVFGYVCGRLHQSAKFVPAVREIRKLGSMAEEWKRDAAKRVSDAEKNARRVAVLMGRDPEEAVIDA